MIIKKYSNRGKSKGRRLVNDDKKVNCENNLHKTETNMYEDLIGMLVKSKAEMESRSLVAKLTEGREEKEIGPSHANAKSFAGELPERDKEIIVSMTSWPKRIKNVEPVLKTILAQTLLPDRIVINLSLVEFPEMEQSLPQNLLDFIGENGIIEINWVEENTKVYKKIIPTMLKYKDALVVGIDDDFSYPEGMLEDMYRVYLKNPNSPIAGNVYGYGNAEICHCGCASMVQYKFYEGYIEEGIKEISKKCNSSDLFYTYVAKLNGYDYVSTKGKYFTNMKTINPVYSYSKNSGKDGSGISLSKSWNYLVKNVLKK